jgi:hypothetical protein
VADEDAVLVEAEVVVEVTAAQVEGFAYQQLLDLFIGDAALLGDRGRVGLRRGGRGRSWWRSLWGGDWGRLGSWSRLG